jgi:hypothetical protein
MKYQIKIETGNDVIDINIEMSLKEAIALSRESEAVIYRFCKESDIKITDIGELFSTAMSKLKERMKRSSSSKE